MKIVCWNLKNIGQSKLTNKLSPVLAAAGLGGTGLDYMMKVVMGDTAWQNITSAAPADVFVIIELKSGGTAKGAISTGTSNPTLAAITKAMNTVAAAPTLTANYHYTSVQPLIIGRHECVGIVYNDKVLTYVSASVLRNNATGNYLPGRAPFMAEFTVIAGGTPLRLVGVHAPPPKGTATTRFKGPIQYAADLPEINAINQTQVADQKNLCVMGDFNCSPASTYTKGNGTKKSKVTAFADLLSAPIAYLTQLPTPTLTSCRKTVVSTNPAPTNYLSDAYDNIFYKMSGLAAAPVATQMDVIGNARDMANGAAALYPAKVRMLLGNYWKVSDHIPVVMTY